jgi:glutamate/tyrosine decarboxylase-like PLP-dependent enzyme
LIRGAATTTATTHSAASISGTTNSNTATPNHKSAFERVLATLAEDSRVNETTRRHQIHEYLAKHEPPAVVDIYRWLYREVLDTDLSDPYLGLGKLLTQNYPFDDEN